MYEPTLTDYLECLENSFEFGTDENTFEVWLKLRECMARIEPTEGKVIYKQLDRIQQLIEKMEPTDIRVKHREWYLGNRYLFDKGNYANRWKMLEDKKLSAVKEIFDEYGSEEVERFGCAVKNVHDVANKLGRFLRPNEMSLIIEKCFIGILSKEFTINCLISFVYTQGAEKLLETSLCQMEDEFMLKILSKIPFSLQLLDVINQVLDDDTAYWEKGAMPYSCYDAEELKIIVEKLVACKRYVTAVNIIGHSECEAAINAECIYKLMKLAGTEESIGVETLDDYAVQKIIGWFQQQEDIDLELRSDIEFIYLPMLDDYSEVRPRALNTRLSLEPEYFCSLIELFYKKRNGEKQEVKPIIMKFAPWNYSDKDNLISMFFQSLKNKINVQDNEELKNKVGKALSDYAGAFDALSLVPVIGSGVAAILKTLAQAKGTELMECADLDMTRRILEDALIQAEKKIIIVIDDIDRLANSQITTKYEDHFVAENRLIAISKSGRSMDSEDVQNFLNATDRGIDVQLFVRKNKDDKISKEFYYLGRVIATGNAKQFVMPNTDKTAVEIEWELETPVREDIYQYIVNE